MRREQKKIQIILIFIGLSLIIAQAWFFVPCSSFEYSPYTQLFTRILNNDNLFKGLSGFATEMSELQSIIEYSDNNSLILDNYSIVNISNVRK